MEETTFSKLSIGQTFRMDRGVESGLLNGLGKPGRVTWTKVANLSYSDVASGVTYRVGSKNCKVWTD